MSFGPIVAFSAICQTFYPQVNPSPFEFVNIMIIMTLVVSAHALLCPERLSKEQVGIALFRQVVSATAGR